MRRGCERHGIAEPKCGTEFLVSISVLYLKVGGQARCQWKRHGNDTANEPAQCFSPNSFSSRSSPSWQTTHGLPTNCTARKPDYINWRQLKTQGVNLGGWLVQEPNIDPTWWTAHGGSLVSPNSTEWSLCANLGSECGPALEARYASWITRADIDELARRANITLLRIPTTYAAWLRVPGSQYYTGNQTRHLLDIATYAIEKYDMHVVIDLHSLPGGINGLGNGEDWDHRGWFHNETNLAYSFEVVEKVLAFIQTSGHPDHYTFEPINEPADNPDLLGTFGHPESLSTAGAQWVKRYFDGVISRVETANPFIPMMLQTFKPETFWSAQFARTENIAFDAHNYVNSDAQHFINTSVSSATLAAVLEEDVLSLALVGDGIFPVFVGEWSIATGEDNSLALRERNFKTARRLCDEYTRGDAMWTAKQHGVAKLAGEGVEADYWDFERFIELGFLN